MHARYLGSHQKRVGAGGGETEYTMIGASGEDCFDLFRAIHFYLDMRGVRETGAHRYQARDVASPSTASMARWLLLTITASESE